MLEIKYFFIRSRLIELYFISARLHLKKRTVLTWTVKLTAFLWKTMYLHLHATCLGKDKYLGA